ncbi:hypothetical protein ACOME3_005645 [Neoechinorhynchus agilis]
MLLLLLILLTNGVNNVPNKRNFQSDTIHLSMLPEVDVRQSQRSSVYKEESGFKRFYDHLTANDMKSSNMDLLYPTYSPNYMVPFVLPPDNNNNKPSPINNNNNNKNPINKGIRDRIETIKKELDSELTEHRIRNAIKKAMHLNDGGELLAKFYDLLLGKVVS